MEIIDLTLQLQDGLKTFASHPRFTLLDQVTYEFSAPRYQPPCEGFASKLLIASDHGGTHVDAPSHFIKGGKDIHEVPLQQLIGPAVCIDVSDKAPDAVIDSAMLAHRCEERAIEIRQGDIVLLRAFPGRWGDPGFYEWQGINDDGAAWLQEKGIKALGMDLAMVDEVGNPKRPVHMRMLGADILLIENLVHLDRVANRRFLFIGLPLNVKGATASPIRAIAIPGKENALS
ncbi:cyclase family protein [Alicyclobacillus macrosporangiidus]|uniref:cyclase family protein n=1 Tax=Alicyclobacillus macrosporangiidus TaxID=392015 RepID=UPI000691A487|nr:cyclase family protein [Alicyclobacillus macrosporangiidus]